MARACGGSTSPSRTTRSTRPWPPWTSLPESGRWTRQRQAASSTWGSASSGCSGNSAPDERRQHGDQPVGELAHQPGVFWGSVTTESSNFDRCRCLTSLPSGDGERPSLVGQRNTACPLRTVETSALRRAQRLVPKLRVPHLRRPDREQQVPRDPERDQLVVGQFSASPSSAFLLSRTCEGETPM